MRKVEDLHIRELIPLVSPRLLKSQLPITEAVANTVAEARDTIRQIVRREDPRFLVVIGPCSIHDPAAAMAYAERLYEAQARFRERLFMIMRVYLEKPRTTIGWRGFLNDPYIDGSFDMATGLRMARELLLQINSMGLPIATEMLDPISPQYLADLVSLGSIGARTTEAQTHRAMVSGLSMPVGFKNSTDGDIQVAVNAVLSAAQPHSFFGIDQDGKGSVVKTGGNPDGLVMLRGGRRGPNYDAESIAQAEQLLRKAGLPQALMVDCSHANSNSDYTRQEQVWNTVLRQHLENRDAVIGMMVESNLCEGKQAIPTDLSQLKYGVSITDGCIGWETTIRMMEHAYNVLGQ